MDSLDILCLLHRTETAGVRHDTSLADLAVRSRVRSRTAHIQSGGTTLILSKAVWLTVVQLLAGTHASNCILAGGIAETKVHSTEMVSSLTYADARIEPVHREGVIARATSQSQVGSINDGDVGAMSCTITVALVTLSPQVELIRKREAVYLAGVEPSGISSSSPSSFKERVDGRTATASGATSRRIRPIRHLVANNAVSPLVITSILRPESCTCQSCSRDHVVMVFTRLNARDSVGLPGDQTVGTTSSAFHP
jgi:hypothetical protein